jgi:hypothetical protein
VDTGLVGERVYADEPLHCVTPFAAGYIIRSPSQSEKEFFNDFLSLFVVLSRQC